VSDGCLGKNVEIVRRRRPWALENDSADALVQYPNADVEWHPRGVDGPGVCRGHDGVPRRWTAGRIPSRNSRFEPAPEVVILSCERVISDIRVTGRSEVQVEIDAVWAWLMITIGITS